MAKRKISYKIRRKIVRLLNSLFNTDFRLSWKQNEYLSSKWKARVEAMSALIKADEKSILDLGCGAQFTKLFISPEVSYYPIDYISRDKGVIVCDFNKHEFPDTKADLCFCSGVLEYIEDLDWFVGKISGASPSAIISYNCKSDPTQRRSEMWVNGLTETELIKLFATHGFTCDKKIVYGRTSIFRFTK